MKNTVVVQARMGSKRLRGKTLMPVAGKTLLNRVIETCRQFDFAQEIIIATTSLEEDNPVVSFARELGLKSFQGDAVNVLQRFADATMHLSESDNIIRITADNPLNRTELSRKLLQIHQEHQNDYTCIDGLSHIVFEVIRVRALREAAVAENLTLFDQEHVTPYFRRNPTLFRTEVLPPDFGGLRHDLDRYLTIDSLDDLERFEKLASEVEINGSVDFGKVYDWLDKNELHVRQEEKELVIDFFGTKVGDGFPTYIIAEIGQNHNGDVRLAKKLIDMAVRCGASAVKFQKRDIPSELSKEAFDKPYDNPNSFGRTYGEHRIFLELDEEQHRDLKEYALAQGITYFCTPCDVPSLELLERIGCPFYKVASRDLTNIPLLEGLAKTGKPVIISTGMADFEDIDDALSTLKLGPDKLFIMQCTSEYPCKLENVNLRAMKTLRDRYGYLVGLSDHTSGVIVSAAASVMGARMIEKHITLDRTMKGTDQPGSLEEAGLKKLVDYIRATELALGDGTKEFNPAVLSAKHKLARSLTSKVAIQKGQPITEDFLCLKSPGNGILWRDRHQVLGKKASVDILPDVTLDSSMFE
jgi:sialic acid synthase